MVRPSRLERKKNARLMGMNRLSHCASVIAESRPGLSTTRRRACTSIAPCHRKAAHMGRTRRRSAAMQVQPGADDRDASSALQSSQCSTPCGRPARAAKLAQNAERLLKCRRVTPECIAIVLAAMRALEASTRIPRAIRLSIGTAAASAGPSRLSRATKPDADGSSSPRISSDVTSGASS